MEAVHELATALVAVEAEAEAELQSLDPRRRVVDPCRGVRVLLSSVSMDSCAVVRQASTELNLSREVDIIS